MKNLKGYLLVIVYIPLISCISSKRLDIKEKEEIYDVINSYLTSFDNNVEIRLTKKNYSKDWSEYFKEPLTITKIKSEQEKQKIKKEYDSIASKLNLNKKQTDSLYKKNSPFRLQWSEMFNEDDIQSAKKQIEANSQKNIRWDKNKLKNVVFDKEGRIFSIPVFSKDGNYAVIYSYSPGGATLFYFEKKNGRWKWIGHSMAWVS